MSLTYVKAPQQQQQSSGILGTLGTLATLGGMVTGQPWLGMLGTGLGAADTLINGRSSGGGGSANTASATGDLGKLLKQLKDNIWVNPSDNNVAKSEEKQAKEAAGKIVNEGNSKSSNSASISGSDAIYTDFDGKQYKLGECGIAGPGPCVIDSSRISYPTNGYNSYYTTPGWINFNGWRF